jgi:hypothetical protein
MKRWLLSWHHGEMLDLINLDEVRRTPGIFISTVVSLQRSHEAALGHVQNKVEAQGDQGTAGPPSVLVCYCHLSGLFSERTFY